LGRKTKAKKLFPSDITEVAYFPDRDVRETKQQPIFIALAKGNIRHNIQSTDTSSNSSFFGSKHARQTTIPV
jgi:hypothetical protein